MMDVVDIAQSAVERLEEAARRFGPGGHPAPGPKATGRCLWCDEPLEDGRRWCDSDCRDDWERAKGVTR
ncbi:MAG: hypothetical protein LBU45_09210 [Azoarcus sp.]|jgi:hypothetical protein|nr:hypothetical protein [Azoarcus sp.]